MPTPYGAVVTESPLLATLHLGNESPSELFGFVQWFMDVRRWSCALVSPHRKITYGELLRHQNKKGWRIPEASILLQKQQEEIPKL